MTGREETPRSLCFQLPSTVRSVADGAENGHSPNWAWWSPTLQIHGIPTSQGCQGGAATVEDYNQMILLALNIVKWRKCLPEQRSQSFHNALLWSGLWDSRLRPAQSKQLCCCLYVIPTRNEDWGHVAADENRVLCNKKVTNNIFCGRWK